MNRNILITITFHLLVGLMALRPDISNASTNGSGLLAPVINPGDYAIALEPVATGLTAPNWGTFAPGEPDRLFVSDQNGKLWAIDLSNGSKTVFLDISNRLVPLGIAGPGTFDERGLLGVAFHPDYETNGLIYTMSSEPVNGAADFSTIPLSETADHQAVLLEWEVPDPGNPVSVVLTSTVRELLRIDQPQFNHNGGGINFGPDSMLYLSLGDGGASDDQGMGHSTSGNGQDPLNILGTILRIDPQGSNSVNGKYGIPVDNPFVGDSDVLDEIYAYGFRNPFRFSFDSETGKLYVGDVGQNDIEEVDLVTAGGNYGWNVKEGSFCFDPNGSSPGFAYEGDTCPGETPGIIDPIAEYNTSESLAENQDGRAIVGGFVYHGERMPPLQGAYIFGDFSQFTESGVNNAGRLFYIFPDSKLSEDLSIYEFAFADRDELGLSLLGIAQDANGELYVLANETGTPFETTGVVLRIAPLRVELSAEKDNTLYEDVTGSISNGAGSHLFVGKTNTGAIRRGLISFDIAGSLPSGATITNARLELHMSRTTAISQTVSLHRLTRNWGEGISNANANEGGGVPATPGDATWLHTIFNTQLWATPGGDYLPSPSASTPVGGIDTYTWGNNPTIISDIQQWIDNPGNNYGWILIGNENQTRTTKRFDTKENPLEETHPNLIIEYLPTNMKGYQMFIPLILR